MKAIQAKERLTELSERQWKRLAAAGLALLFVVVLVLALFPLLDGGTPAEIVTYAMGSYVQQTVYGGDGDAIAARAANAVQALENEISWRAVGGDIQRLNEHAGNDWIELSAETVELLALAQEVCEKSGGAFDVTVAPLTHLWDFDDAKNEVPDAAEIEERLRYVGGEFLRLDLKNNTASLKNTGNAVDLGGLGKGAACDAALEVYEAEGAKAAVIAVGGSIGVYGTKPAGGSWNIAVRDPNGEGSAGVFSIDSGFVSTSGSYEKCFEKDGVLYHHLLDPHTGMPARTGLRSVTVWSESGALSDMLSTACFVLGEKDGAALLEAFGAEGIFIREDGGVAVTDGIEDRFRLTAEGYASVPLA